MMVLILFVVPQRLYTLKYVAVLALILLEEYGRAGLRLHCKAIRIVVLSSFIGESGRTSRG